MNCFTKLWALLLDQLATDFQSAQASVVADKRLVLGQVSLLFATMSMNIPVKAVPDGSEIVNSLNVVARKLWTYVGGCYWQSCPS